jgi:hypothetical protein
VAEGGEGCGREYSDIEWEDVVVVVEREAVKQVVVVVVVDT